MAGLHEHRGRGRLSPRLDRTQSGLDAAAAGAGMVPAFQPIVALSDRATVGFEALARWPGLDGSSPRRVFERAGDIGTTDVLDRSCVDGSVAAALSYPLTKGSLLCVNVEPSTRYFGRNDSLVLARGHDELNVVFEITERRPLAHPSSLLRKVAALRADGFAVALDDVGAHPDSLALLDIVLPEVIKLDLALVQVQPTRAQAQTLAAVLAHHERTDAVILAEGIETDEHLEQAMAVGATLGQGYLFGRPGPLVEDVGSTWSPVAHTQRDDPGTGSPFDLVAGTTPVRTARKQTLIGFSHHIESQADQAVDAPMVLIALQRDEYFTDAVKARYRDLATSCPMVAVFGQDMPSDLGSGVRGVGLHPTDPLCAEWTVVALGPHHAAALIAREHDDDLRAPRNDGDRRFDFVMTYDRALVAAAARNLLARMP